jgi:hypothetical protein
VVAGVIAVGMRLLRRMAHPQPEVLYRTKVTAGDVFEITARRRQR